MGRHVIDRLSFEVDFTAEADAVAQQEVLGDFANARGLAVIQEVFDEFSGPDEVVRLDRLDVDLGEVDFLADPAAAAERLREAVREALQAALRRGGASPDPEGAVPRAAASPAPPESWRFDVAGAELDLVWTQLQTGQLPWSASGLSAAAFDDLVWRVADRQAEALAAHLRRSPHVADLLARLVRQWPERAQQAFAARLAAPLAVPLAAASGVGPSSAASSVSVPGSAALGGAVAARVAAFIGLLAPAAASGEVSGSGGRAPEGASSATRAAAGRRTRRGASPAPEGAVPGSAARSAPPQSRGFDVAGADLDLVWTQLQTGQLPWSASGLSADAFDDLVWRVADRQAEALAAHLRRSPRAADLLARLVRQWPERAQQAFAARLAAPLAAPLAAASAATSGVPPSPVASPTSSPGLEELAGVAAGRVGAEAARVAAFIRLLAPAAATREAADLGPRLPERVSSAAAASPAGDGVGDRAIEPSLRRELERQLLAARLEDALRRRLLAQAPAWLAARLRDHGRAAAWRDRMADALDAAGLEALVGIWATPAEAALLASLATGLAAWPRHPRETAAAVGRHLRASLLDEVLLAEPGFDLAATVAGLVQRFADFAELAPRQVADHLAQAWPEQGPASDRGQEIVALLGPLRTEAALPATRAMASPVAEVPVRDPGAAPTAGEPGEADPTGATPSRRRLLQALDGGAPSRLVAAVDEALLEDAAWLRRALVARAAEPRVVRRLIEALDAPRLFAIVELGLSERDVRFLLAATPPAAAGLAASRAFWSEVLTVGLSDAPGALAAWLAPRRGAPGSPTPPGPSAGPGAIVGGEAPEPGSPSSRASEASPPAPEPGQVARRAGEDSPSEDRPGGRATGPQAEAPVPSGPDPFGPDPSAQDPWALDGLLQRLPQRPSATTARAVLPVLAPTEAGLARLAPLAEARRRDLFLRLRPVDGLRALEAADRLAQAARQAALAEPAEGWALRIWRVLLLELVEEGRRFDPARLARRWADLAAGGDDHPVRASLHAALARGVGIGRSDVERMAAALAPDPAGGEAGASPLQPLPPTVWGFGEPEADATLYVANAGAVLVGPYLPALFGRLGLLTEGRFTDGEAAERAVHLLQFVVDGGGPAPEHLLSLNKLLCGLDLTTPIGRDFAILDAERTTIEGLLATLIQRWSILGRTSVAGLRESFLQREGALATEDDGWRLTVAPRAFDMLLDQIPWGYGTQRLQWMTGVLHVEWR